MITLNRFFYDVMNKTEQIQSISPQYKIKCYLDNKELENSKVSVEWKTILLRLRSIVIVICNLNVIN